MFTISAQFLKNRSNPFGRDGVVAITVTSNRKGCADYKLRREVRLDFHGADKSVFSKHKDEIVQKMRLLYCVIERLAIDEKEFNLDDIVTDFRLAMSGDATLSKVTAKADTDFPLRADLVSIGREFRGYFDYVYPSKSLNTNSLSDYIDAKIQALRNTRKTSCLRSYEATHSKLKEFTGNDNISFSAVNKDFIKNFANWLNSSSIAESTQSFYLRTLRSILNHARTEHLISGDSNWFKGVDTRIIFKKATDNAAQSLGRDTLKEIRQLDLSGDHETQMTRDMFMFGFYCHGMELVDIAHLTPDNIRGGHLVYSRRKAGKEITVPLDPDALKIIQQYQSAGSRYLFPLLYDDGRFSFDSMRNHVHIAIKKIGKFIGYPSLSFSMNIAAYKNILSQCQISSLL